MSSCRIGIDVGGTFTDVFLLNDQTGQMYRHKLPSTPANPHEAAIRGMVEILELAHVDIKDVGFVGLGTTVATNALLERKGSVTGLITTEGFRDILEVGRQKRPHTYDLTMNRPEPLVPRRRRLGVGERMAHDGSVVKSLDMDSVSRVLRELLQQKEKVESIAIFLLNAYANPEHERLILEKIQQEAPALFVSASHQVSPEYREYERLSSTVINSYLMPIMKRYLKGLQQKAEELSFQKEPYVMTSGGGVISLRRASDRPIDTLYSGPSGGVSGSVYVANLVGHPDIICFDVGGTSTDVCLVRGGQPEITQDRIIGGMPLKSTALDVHSVGTGGGSIAWIDAGGMLRVGPQSAGAVPGPACYSRGGKQATSTDANVVLGRLNPEFILGGRFRIDARAAHTAVDEHIARKKKLKVHEAAAAAIEVMNTNIAQAISYVSVQRGLDPRDFVFVAFGGAGPLQVAAVAKQLSARAVLVPADAGVLCAMGVLAKDIQIDVSLTKIFREKAPDTMAAVQSLYDGLESQARTELERDIREGSELLIERSVDARYVGQNHELRVAVSGGAIDQICINQIKARFDVEHKRYFGFDQPDAELEFVTFRVRAALPLPRPDLLKFAGAEGKRRRKAPEPFGRREVFFDEEGKFIKCPLYERSKLFVGDELRGPAIIEQMDATTLLPPGFVVRVDVLRNLFMTEL